MAQDNIKDKEISREEAEIDILELLSKLWNQRRTLIKWSIWGAVIGLVVAFSIPKEYLTEVKLAPESDDSKSGAGGLSSLASMAGINIGAGGGVDAVYPLLYPDVVNSVPFMTGLFDVEVRTSGDDSHEVTVKNYLENETRKPWWSHIIGFPIKVVGMLMPKDDVDPDHKLDNFKLTLDEDKLVKALQNCISVSVDTKTSVVTIDVQMQDPVVSAMLADTVVARLQEYITGYRTNKARQDLEYAQTLNEEARQNYYDAQQRYADYLDRNQGLALHSAQTTRERLQNEASLAFNLYNQTAQQVQVAQAKVQENTPVYAIVQPATVAVKASSPRKVLLLVGFTFLAFVLCSVWILFGKSALSAYKEKAKQSESTSGDDAPKKG